MDKKPLFQYFKQNEDSLNEYYTVNNIKYDNKVLTYDIIRHYKQQYITRYEQKNYVKSPIYDTKWKEKKVSKYKDTIINLQKYIDQEIFFDPKIDSRIYAQDVVAELLLLPAINLSAPKWFRNLCEIDALNAKNKTNYDDYSHIQEEKNNYQYKRTDYKAQQSSKKWLILNICLTLFTFGLIWFSYTSKNKALKYQRLNTENATFNQNIRNNFDNQLASIQNTINEYLNQIETLKKENQAIETSSVQTDNYEWINLKIALRNSNDYEYLQKQIGCYVIWNKTKNIYYCGQTHNLFKRIFTQHFDRQKKDVKNILFARDWFDGDDFYFRYEYCSVQELDRIERDLIAKYDSFRNGYNQTAGNNFDKANTLNNTYD